MRQNGRKPNARSQPPRRDDSPCRASEAIAASPEPHPGQALAQLRLTPGDFALLRRQGHVSCERRGARQVSTNSNNPAPPSGAMLSSQIAESFTNLVRA